MAAVADSWQEHWSDCSSEDDDFYHDEHQHHHHHQQQYEDQSSYHPQQYSVRNEGLKHHPLDMMPPMQQHHQHHQQHDNKLRRSTSEFSDSSGENSKSQKRKLLDRKQNKQRKNKGAMIVPSTDKNYQLSTSVNDDDHHHHHGHGHGHPNTTNRRNSLQSLQSHYLYTLSNQGGYNRHRADAWLYLLMTSSISLGSLVNHSTVPQVIKESSTYVTGLGLVCVVLALAVIMAVGYRVEAFRRLVLSGSHGHQHHQYSPPRILSAELGLTILAFLLQLSSMPLLLSGSHYLATRGTMVENSNLFFSTWSSFGLLTFLLSNLLSSWDGSGKNYICTLWISAFFTTNAVLATSISLRYTSPICQGILSTSHVCDSPTATVVTSILNLILCILALIVARLSSIHSMTMRRARRTGLALAVSSLMIQTIGTIYATSPGGMGFVSGNLFLVLWTSTVLAFLLVVGYINQSSVSVRSLPSGSVGMASVYSVDVHHLRGHHHHVMIEGGANNNGHSGGAKMIKGMPSRSDSRMTETSDTEDESSNESHRYQIEHGNANAQQQHHLENGSGVIPPPAMLNTNPRSVASSAAQSNSQAPSISHKQDARGLNGQFFGDGVSIRASNLDNQPNGQGRQPPSQQPDAEGSLGYHSNQTPPQDPDPGYDASASNFNLSPSPPPPPPAAHDDDDEVDEEDNDDGYNPQRRRTNGRAAEASGSKFNGKASMHYADFDGSLSGASGLETRSKSTKSSGRSSKSPSRRRAQQQQQQAAQTYAVPTFKPKTGSFTSYQGQVAQGSYASVPSFKSVPHPPPPPPPRSVATKSQSTSSSGLTPRTVDEEDCNITMEEEDDGVSLATPMTETEESPGPSYAQHHLQQQQQQQHSRQNVASGKSWSTGMETKSSSEASSSFDRSKSKSPGRRSKSNPKSRKSSKSPHGNRSRATSKSGSGRSSSFHNNNNANAYQQQQQQQQPPQQQQLHHQHLYAPVQKEPVSRGLYPMQSVTTFNVSDSDSIISDPTIDNSIMTSKQKGVEREKQVNHAVAAALAHAEAFKKTSSKKSSKSGSSGTNVDEIVAAAIAAATSKNGSGGGGGVGKSSSHGSGGGGRRAQQGSSSNFQHPYHQMNHPTTPRGEDKSTDVEMEKSSIHSFYSGSKHSRGEGSHQSYSFDC